VKTSWFNCVAQKSATATMVESYLTTFHRLSPDLLNLIVNCADGEVLVVYGCLMYREGLMYVSTLYRGA